MEKVSIGSIVNYEGNGKIYPAIVITVKEDNILSICIFKENTTQFLPVVYFSVDREPGCWSERVKSESFSVKVSEDFGVAKQGLQTLPVEVSKENMQATPMPKVKKKPGPKPKNK